MSHRLPPIPSEWIDRSQRLEFTFEGDRVWGYAGDTITSALWASGRRVLGRSFKYHRPRGILSLANHDINGLMQDGQKLNLRADMTPLEAGMTLVAVNTNGGVRNDRHSILDFFSPFLPVGFYYKAFHNKRFFPFWERLIRSVSGLGKVDISTPHLHTAKQYDFCDVLVIGAGVSGLSAAIELAEAGADVVIVDENPKLGGSGSYQLGGDYSQLEQVHQLVDTVQHHKNIRIYTQTVAAAYYADHWIPLVENDRMTKMRAKAVIMANGAYEKPAVFRNNDLPGVMLASAAQRLIYRYAVKPMQRAVVLTANDDGYRVALDLVKHGVEVKAIVDLRGGSNAFSQELPWLQSSFSQANSAGGLPPAPPLRGVLTPPHPPKGNPCLESNSGVQQFCLASDKQEIPIYRSHCIYEARSNPAQDGVSSAIICPLDDEGKPQPEFKQSIACDGIVMSVGWAPAANLLYQAGAKMRFDAALQQFVPDRLPAGIFACGRVNGVYDVAQKLQDGQRAAQAAIAHLNLPPQSAPIPHSPFPNPHSPTPYPPSHPYPIIDHPAGKNFVDFDEDLQLKDFPNTVQEGFDNIELLKRFTTVGMGPSQGKHSNMNALRILAKLTGKTPGEVGTTTARPFFHPVPLSHLAGKGFTPERHTPLHDRHVALNAKFMLAGHWRRPEYYVQSEQTRVACIQSEANTVRTQVGLIDVGTLGKLELRGADAVELLERVYTGCYRNLKVGISRYALMLDEAGVVIDDGVIARLGTEHFYFTTTTSNAVTIYRELSRLITLWQLDCGLVNVTGARSALNLAGPQARQVLAQLTDLDLSGAAFPYLGVREAEVAGIPALLMRVGFVGEWGYEIHTAAESAPALWDALLDAGLAYGIAPFGVEAQRLLRLEKGHLIVGQDTDGLTTPVEAGLEWAVKLDKPFFVGQRSLQAIAKRPAQKKLVGFMLEPNFEGTPPQECHLVIDGEDIAGRVTSIAYSPTLQRYIGLAYVTPRLATIGDSIWIRLSDRALIPATISHTPFYDPENTRQKEPVMPRQELAV